MADQERRALARACLDGMMYLADLQAGFFAPLQERTVVSMLQGSGSELATRSWPVPDAVRADGTVSRRLMLAKRQALLSSSVLCLSMFDYWRGRTDRPLGAALGVTGAIADVALEAPLATGVWPARSTSTSS